ncbi:MAG: hypothetical protein K6A98_06085 [Prevotella sp.]|nr:hypothetical protein [Prevotella sp.]
MRKFTLSTVMMLAAAATFTLSSCGDPYYDDYHYGPGYGPDYYGPGPGGGPGGGDQPGGGGQDEGYSNIELAQALDGQWQGTINSQYIDSDGNQKSENYNSEFHFRAQNKQAISGDGLEVDYDAQGNTVYDCEFTWYINSETQEIILSFNDNRVMTISDFTLDMIENEYANHFQGIMKNSTETCSFNLYRKGYYNANTNKFFSNKE